MPKATKTIDINKADLNELMELRMVGEGRAKNLIKYREEHGPFKSWDDVARVPSFDPVMIEDMKKSGATIGGMKEEEAHRHK